MENKGMMNKLQNILLPVGNFLANEKHFASVQAGLMTSVGVTLLGAICQLISSPPVTAEIMEKGGIASKIFGGWYYFAQNNKVALSVPYNMSMGLFAVIVAFSIAYQLARKYDMEPLSNGIVSMIIFLMVAAPATAYALKDGSFLTAISTNYLGGTGLFTAIIVGLLSVEISRFCNTRNLVIKMPDVVPSFLQDSFRSLIPLIFNVVIFYGVSLILQAKFNMIMPQAIMEAIATPLHAANSIPGAILILFVAMLLWCVGVHGTNIVYPLFLPIMIQETMKNAALVSAGQHPVFSPIFLVGSSIALVGGSGNTLGFVILCLRSKSEQLKVIGKIGIIPGLFGVNEPVMFGAPIVLNPILAIPYVLGTLILALITWAGFSIGLLTPPYVLLMSLLPIGVASFIQAMNVMNLIFPFLMIPVMMIIWYPFFKVYEKQLIEQEQAAKIEGEAATN